MSITEIYMHALPMEQENNFQADKLIYFSQLHSFPDIWKFIAHRACGITAAAMAMSIVRPDIKPLDVLIKAIDLHKVPSREKNFWFIAPLDARIFRIPIGTQIDTGASQAGLEITDIPQIQTSEYFPVISTQNGYDHRGSALLFSEFGINAVKVGDPKEPISEISLKKMILSGNVIMASVKNSVTPWRNDLKNGGPASHIVLITDIVNLNNQDWYYIVDPYSPSQEKVAIMRPCTSFHAVEFSGYGTAVQTKK